MHFVKLRSSIYNLRDLLRVNFLRGATSISEHLFFRDQCAFCLKLKLSLKLTVAYEVLCVQNHLISITGITIGNVLAFSTLRALINIVFVFV